MTDEGRKDTNSLLIQLMKQLNVHYSKLRSIVLEKGLATNADVSVRFLRVKLIYLKVQQFSLTLNPITPVLFNPLLVYFTNLV